MPLFKSRRSNRSTETDSLVKTSTNKTEILREFSNKLKKKFDLKKLCKKKKKPVASGSLSQLQKHESEQTTATSPCTLESHTAKLIELQEEDKNGGKTKQTDESTVCNVLQAKQTHMRLDTIVEEGDILSTQTNVCYEGEFCVVPSAPPILSDSGDEGEEEEELPGGARVPGPSTQASRLTVPAPVGGAAQSSPSYAPMPCQGSGIRPSEGCPYAEQVTLLQDAMPHDIIFQEFTHLNPLPAVPMVKTSERRATEEEPTDGGETSGSGDGDGATASVPEQVHQISATPYLHPWDKDGGELNFDTVRLCGEPPPNTKQYLINQAATQRLRPVIHELEAHLSQPSVCWDQDFSQGKREITADHTTATQNVPLPSKIKQLRTFSRLWNYSRAWFESYSELCVVPALGLPDLEWPFILFAHEREVVMTSLMWTHKGAKVSDSHCGDWQAGLESPHVIQHPAMANPSPKLFPPDDIIDHDCDDRVEGGEERSTKETSLHPVCSRGMKNSDGLQVDETVLEDDYENGIRQVKPEEDPSNVQERLVKKHQEGCAVA